MTDTEIKLNEHITSEEKRWDSMEGKIDKIMNNHLVHVQGSLNDMGVEVKELANKLNGISDGFLIIKDRMDIGGKAVWLILAGVLGSLGFALIDLIRK